MASETRFIITTRPHYTTKYWGGNRGWTYHAEHAHHYKTFDAANAAVKRNKSAWKRYFGYEEIKLKEITITPARGIVAGKESEPMSDQPKPNYIQEARSHAAELEARMNRNHPGGIEERALYEDRPFKRGMLAASIAQAEQLRRIANMMQGYLETYADPAVLASAFAAAYIDQKGLEEGGE